MRVILFAVAFLSGVSLFAEAAEPSRSPRNTTSYWQAKIDAVSRAGGGVVSVPKGDWAVAGLSIRSGVELHLEEGARLLGLTNRDEYVEMKSVIHAIGMTNVAITGKGTVDGIGAQFDRIISRKPFKRRGGWRTITFERCRNVRIEGVTILGGAGWTCFLSQNDGVVVRGIRMRSHANYNNDGLDVDSRNVLIEDCDIDAEDDALVFKTHNPDFAADNIVVRRCRLASNSSTLKFGTETLGAFRHIRIGDCTLGCGESSRFINPHDAPGERPGSRNHAISGIEISSVDGAWLQDVIISNIVMGAGINTPVFVRLAHRKDCRNPFGGAALKDVLIENVKMTEPSTSAIACSISGLPDLRPQNVIIRNCCFLFGGGGTTENAQEHYTDERPKVFPMPINLFKSALPAYGFYIRHADGVVFDGVSLSLKGPDPRPPAVADDADVRCVNCNFEVLKRE